jgi:hypothetical protein
MNQFDPETSYLNTECVEQFADAFDYWHFMSEMSFPMKGIFISALQREEDAQAATFHNLFVRSCDFQTPPKRGDRVLFGRIQYTVFEIRSDHGGGTWLALNVDCVG